MYDERIRLRFTHFCLIPLVAGLICVLTYFVAITLTKVYKSLVVILYDSQLTELS